MRGGSWSFAAFMWAGAAGVAAATGGTATDQAAALTYAETHWGGDEPSATLVGVDAAPGTLRAAGWWYRLEGDTREHPLPLPDVERYEGGRIRASWNDLGGSGIALGEVTEVFDSEGPSGGFVTYLIAMNQGPRPKSLTLFHYLDANLGGTAGGDAAIAVRPGFMTLSDGASRAAYRAARPSHFRVAAGAGIKAALNDDASTELDDSGLPFGPGDVTAAYQFGPTVLQPCLGCSAPVVGLVSFFANPAHDHVKGDLLGVLGQAPLLFASQDGSVGLALWLRRSQLIFGFNGVDRFGSPAPTARLAGVDDFDGDLTDELVFRDVESGVTTVGATPISGAPTLPFNWRLSATGDFDHDGKADILWRNSSSQKLVVWTMNGARKTGSLVPNPDHAADANWEVAGAADFDGDGNRDLLWYNQTTGKLVLWRLDAALVRTTGQFTTPSGVGSNAWRVVAVGDYGKGPGGVHDTPDIVWQNDVSQRIVVWHMDRSATRTAGVFTNPSAIGLPTPTGIEPLSVVGPR